MESNQGKKARHQSSDHLSSSCQQSFNQVCHSVNLSEGKKSERQQKKEKLSRALRANLLRRKNITEFVSVSS